MAPVTLAPSSGFHATPPTIGTSSTSTGFDLLTIVAMVLMAVVSLITFGTLGCLLWSRTRARAQDASIVDLERQGKEQASRVVDDPGSRSSVRSSFASGLPSLRSPPSESGLPSPVLATVSARKPLHRTLFGWLTSGKMEAQVSHIRRDASTVSLELQGKDHASCVVDSSGSRSSVWSLFASGPPSARPPPPESGLPLPVLATVPARKPLDRTLLGWFTLWKSKAQVSHTQRDSSVVMDALAVDLDTSEGQAHVPDIASLEVPKIVIHPPDGEQAHVYGEKSSVLPDHMPFAVKVPDEDEMLFLPLFDDDDTDLVTRDRPSTPLPISESFPPMPEADYSPTLSEPDSPELATPVLCSSPSFNDLVQIVCAEPDAEEGTEEGVYGEDSYVASQAGHFVSGQIGLGLCLDGTTNRPSTGSNLSTVDSEIWWDAREEFSVTSSSSRSSVVDILSVLDDIFSGSADWCPKADPQKQTTPTSTGDLATVFCALDERRETAALRSSPSFYDLARVVSEEPDAEEGAVTSIHGEGSTLVASLCQSATPIDVPKIIIHPPDGEEPAYFYGEPNTVLPMQSPFSVTMQDEDEVDFVYPLAQEPPPTLLFISGYSPPTPDADYDSMISEPDNSSLDTPVLCSSPSFHDLAHILSAEPDVEEGTLGSVHGEESTGAMPVSHSVGGQIGLGTCLDSVSYQAETGHTLTTVDSDIWWDAREEFSVILPPSSSSTSSVVDVLSVLDETCQDPSLEDKSQKQTIPTSTSERATVLCASDQRRESLLLALSTSFSRSSLESHYSGSSLEASDSSRSSTSSFETSDSTQSSDSGSPCTGILEEYEDQHDDDDNVSVASDDTEYHECLSDSEFDFHPQWGEEYDCHGDGEAPVEYGYAI